MKAWNVQLSLSRGLDTCADASFILVTTDLHLEKVLKRDFKIHSVVAGDNFNDGLSFVSLSRQIDAGLKAGYKGNETIDAGIRAVSPSLQLRSYLVMIRDL